MILPDFQSTARAAITGWDLADGTLQGGTNVSTSTTGPMNYIAATDNDVFASATWQPLGSRTEGVGTMAAVDPFGVRDSERGTPQLTFNGVVVAEDNYVERTGADTVEQHSAILGQLRKTLPQK